MKRKRTQIIGTLYVQFEGRMFDKCRDCFDNFIWSYISKNLRHRLNSTLMYKLKQEICRSIYDEA